MPGDKSISHRILLLSAIAKGATSVHGANRGEDVDRTIGALRALGIAIRESQDAIDVEGSDALSDPHALRDPAATIDCGNSGSTMRMLAAICAGSVNARLDGDASLRRRPMARVIEPLRAMGADIRSEAGGLPPLKTARAERRLHGIDYELGVPSAQVKSAILLAGLRAEGKTTVTSTLPSRDHTERMIAAMNAPIRSAGPTVIVQAGALHGLPRYDVPGDISAAMFFFVAAAAVDGFRLTLRDVGFNPTRSAALDALRAMGVRLAVSDVRVELGERRAHLTVSGSPRLRGISISGGAVPLLIDELPALCALGAVAAGEFSVRGATELRYKESDRIATIVGLLREFGVEAHELSDGLVVHGGGRLRSPAAVNTCGDHRIGMAAAALGVMAHADITIDDADCIATSFPDFESAWKAAFSPS